MENFQKFILVTATEEFCQKKPCLWSFSVKRVKERKNIDLGIKAGRNRRPGITVWNRYTYKVVFLTTKNNGQPKVDLSYCKRKEERCAEMKWKNSSRIFITNDRKRIFYFPIYDFLNTEKPLAEFCAGCDKEILNYLKEVFSNEP